MNEQRDSKARAREKQAPKNTAGPKRRDDHPKKPAPATRKVKKESPGPQRPKIEIPPEIKTAWAEIDRPLVQAQANLLIKELREEKKEEFELSPIGLFMPEERRAELDRINRELFEEEVEAMFLAYKYERKIRKKQETPEFWEAVFRMGLAPFILQRKDIAKPLLKHWLSRITVEIARLEYEAKSQPPIAPGLSGLVPKKISGQELIAGRRGRKRDAGVVERDRIIATLKNSLAKLKGTSRDRKIAQTLTEQKIPPPESWGVQSFNDAYRDSRLRKRLAKMVTRAKLI